MYRDLVGVKGAHNANIKGAGVTMAIFEEGPYSQNEMDREFPGRWSVGDGEHAMPAPSTPSASKHAYQVATFANSVAPAVHFVMYKSDDSALDYIVNNNKATVINESMYIPQIRTGGSSGTTLTGQKPSEQCMIQTSSSIFGSNEAIMFIAAGNDPGHAACNRVHNPYTGAAQKLTEYSHRNIFFVSNAVSNGGGGYEMKFCYPAEGDADNNFFVCDEGGCGTSFAAPQCAAIAALLQSQWRYFTVHCNQLGILMWETADRIPVTYTKKYDVNVNPIAPNVTVTALLRRPNVQKAFAFDEQVARAMGITYVKTVAHTSAAFGGSFYKLGLQGTVFVDKYGRSWSGLTDKEANIYRNITTSSEPTFASILDWFSDLPPETTSQRIASFAQIQAYGKKRWAQDRSMLMATGRSPAAISNGEMHFTLIPRVQTSIAVNQKPGRASFTSSGTLTIHEYWSHESGLLSMFPAGATVRNHLVYGSYLMGMEFFHAQEKKAHIASTPYALNKTSGGLLSLSGNYGGLDYRVRMGTFHESADVLTTKSAGALSLGAGSITGTMDFTTLWQVSERISMVNTLVYGQTRPYRALHLSMLTPLAPIHTMEIRSGVMMKEMSIGSLPLNWGIFYSEPKRVVSARTQLTMPIEHCMDGSIRYEEKEVNLKPDAKERRFEAVAETSLASGLTLSTSFSRIQNAGHSSFSKPQHAFALSLRGL
jgi:hypothetical protein